MKKYILLIFLILFGIVPYFQAQESQGQIDLLLSEIREMDDDTIKVKKVLSIIDLLPDTHPDRLKYAEEGLTIARKIDWREGMGLCYYTIAWNNFYTNKRDLAIENFQKAIEYSGDPSIAVYSHGCISNTYSWENKHDLALFHAIRAVEASSKDTSREIKALALVFLGDVYRYSDDMLKAKYYYVKATNVMSESGEYEPSMAKMSAYVYLLDSSIGAPFSVLDFAFQLKTLYDTSSPRDKQMHALSLLKVTLAYIHSVEKEHIRRVELEAREKQKYVYIAGIGFLILIAGLLVWQNYSRKKTNEELAKANEMKSRFFGILNHDLRSPVAGLISYLQLKTVAPEAVDPKDAALFEQKTMKTAKNLLENMEDLLFWCKDQMQSFTPEFKQVAVSKLFEDTKAFFSYEDENINLLFDNPSDLKIKTDENYVKTIMRNLTSNAIAATSNIEQPVIEWKAYVDKKRVILSITNNGMAIPQEKIEVIYKDNNERNIKEGLGLKIVRDLAISINCEIKIEAGEVNGTTFKLIF